MVFFLVTTVRPLLTAVPISKAKCLPNDSVFFSYIVRYLSKPDDAYPTVITSGKKSAIFYVAVGPY